MPYWLAVTLAEAAGTTGSDTADEARAIFERLGARPWIERLERAEATL